MEELSIVLIKVKYLKEFEKELYREVNKLRKNPARYAEKIVKNKQFFKDGSNIWKHPDAKAGIKTEEGPAAYDEAIRFLKNNAQAVGELTPSKGLNKIASDFLYEFQKDPNANVEIEPIVEKRGNFTGNFRRLVQFGSDTAELVVVNLVVCDGDKTRGHRDALLSDNLHQVGVAHGNHDTYRQCSVIVACTKFENTVDGDDSVY